MQGRRAAVVRANGNGRYECTLVHGGLGATAEFAGVVANRGLIFPAPPSLPG